MSRHSDNQHAENDYHDNDNENKNLKMKNNIENNMNMKNKTKKEKAHNRGPGAMTIRGAMSMMDVISGASFWVFLQSGS